MSQIAATLLELKCALQELESAVQLPRDERSSVEHVLDCFPLVITKFEDVVKNVLLAQGIIREHPHERFAEAYNRGWLKGDFSLWLRLISDYQQLKEEDASGARARSVAQDVRACSCILWETYELLTARFRWQTQVRSICKINYQNFGVTYVGQNFINTMSDGTGQLSLTD